MFVWYETKPVNMKKNLLLVLIGLLIPLCGWADKQGYAVFDSETGTLTFKYGEKPEGGECI